MFSIVNLKASVAMVVMVVMVAMVAMMAVVAVVAVAVAPHGQSDGHGHDHSLAVISRPGHQPYFFLKLALSPQITEIGSNF